MPEHAAPRPEAQASAAPTSPAPAFSVCVYCGSRPGRHPAYRMLARHLGTAIGRRGWQLVYGGGRAGLMGEVADAALAAGGRVIGVIPDSLMRLEVGHIGLHELQVVQTMHERKQAMAERADAFIAMPGGIGTFEELFEVWTWRHLGYHDRPIGLLDTAPQTAAAGADATESAEPYWAPLLRFLAHAAREGFMDAGQQAMLQHDTDVERLLDTLHASRGTAAAQDLGRI